MRYGMMIALDKCVGCQACVSACKQRWGSGAGAARDWVLEFEHGKRGKGLGITFYPGLCNHCDDHPCTTECPTRATYMTEHGVVVVDPEVCIGCGNCISLCPYGARHGDEGKQIVEKCNFCAPYVARGEQPACVATCLTGCRHFGDLEDPRSEVSRLIQTSGAQPLTSAEVQVGPQVYYAPPLSRARLLENDVIKAPRSTAMTQIWQRYTRPAARYGVPAIAIFAGAFGLVSNILTRRMRLQHEPENMPGEPSAPTQPRTFPRHRWGMRFLHWFNVLSWIVLLLSGTALMITPSFALFGAAFPTWLSTLVGGPATLIKVHIWWGLVWAALIVPFFLWFKRGGIEALREIWITRDDLRWLVRKPLYMLGLDQRPQPPQDKYNAGQKMFALSALVGTTVIIGSGMIMTLHLGSPEVILWTILVHKLAILLALVGLVVHITMAAIIVEERPALRSMVSGEVERAFAEHHNQKWIEEIEGSTPRPGTRSRPDQGAERLDTTPSTPPPDEEEGRS